MGEDDESWRKFIFKHRKVKKKLTDLAKLAHMNSNQTDAAMQRINQMSQQKNISQSDAAASQNNIIADTIAHSNNSVLPPLIPSSDPAFAEKSIPLNALNNPNLQKKLPDSLKNDPAAQEMLKNMPELANLMNESAPQAASAMSVSNNAQWQVSEEEQNVINCLDWIEFRICDLLPLFGFKRYQMNIGISLACTLM